MDAQAIIEDYVNNVAAKLPRKVRNDIGVELRTLLAEQLHSAAQEAGRSPDGEMAMNLLRRFGSPEEVAARYAPRGFNLIEPEHSPIFVKLAAACVAIQWGVTLPGVFSSGTTLADWWLRWGFSAFGWVGFLVIWFGIASWLQRRSSAGTESGSRSWAQAIFWVPSPREWHPDGPEAGERHATITAITVATAVTVFFIAPAWILDRLLPAGTDTSWAVYHDDFRGGLLPALIALMVARLVLFWAGARNERRRQRTEALTFVLWVSFVALLYWAVFGGPIFAHATTDGLFKAWLMLFLLVNTIQILLWIWRAATRVRVPKTMAHPGKNGSH